MSLESMSPQQRDSVGVKVGSIMIGGGAPVVVQSMTNTDTVNVATTTAQVAQLAQTGSELVRITVNSVEAAKAVPIIRTKLDDIGCHVPLVGDFHFNGHKLLTEVPDCAQALSKFRINPGNVGKGKKAMADAQVILAQQGIIAGDEELNEAVYTNSREMIQDSQNAQDFELKQWIIDNPGKSAAIGVGGLGFLTLITILIVRATKGKKKKRRR